MICMQKHTRCSSRAKFPSKLSAYSVLVPWMMRGIPLPMIATPMDMVQLVCLLCSQLSYCKKRVWYIQEEVKSVSCGWNIYGAKWGV